MAKFENLVPFILVSECGVSPKHIGKPLEQLYEIARKDGYANHSADKGGPTMCGVTLGTYETYCKRKCLPHPTISRLKAMPFAHWFDIYKSMYWNVWKADQITNQAVANILVDWVWASGIQGIKRPQKILGIKVDGIVGPQTIAAVNACNPKELFDKLHAGRLKHFDEIVARDKSQAVFHRGWYNRVNRITYEGFKY